MTDYELYVQYLNHNPRNLGMIQRRGGYTHVS